MTERADCTLRQYVDWLKEWAEGLPPEIEVEANVYFHKTLIAPDPEAEDFKEYVIPPDEPKEPEHPDYAIWLRAEGKKIEGFKAEPFRFVYDKVFTYSDRPQLKVKERKLREFLYTLSKRIEDEGIPVSNLPEFIGGYEEIPPAEIENYEIFLDEDLIIKLRNEVKIAMRFKELNGYGY